MQSLLGGAITGGTYVLTSYIQSHPAIIIIVAIIGLIAGVIMDHVQSFEDSAYKSTWSSKVGTGIATALTAPATVLFLPFVGIPWFMDGLTSIFGGGLADFILGGLITPIALPVMVILDLLMYGFIIFLSMCAVDMPETPVGKIIAGIICFGLQVGAMWVFLKFI